MSNSGNHAGKFNMMGVMQDESAREGDQEANRKIDMSEL
jgi:hypothetical protein